MNLRVNRLYTSYHHTSTKPHVEKSTIRAAKTVAAVVLVQACRKASLEGGGGGGGDGGVVEEAFDGVAVTAIFWPASQWYGVLHMK